MLTRASLVPAEEPDIPWKLVVGGIVFATGVLMVTSSMESQGRGAPITFQEFRNNYLAMEKVRELRVVNVNQDFDRVEVFTKVRARVFYFVLYVFFFFFFLFLIGGAGVVFHKQKNFPPES